jgi:hypothetical protein
LLEVFYNVEISVSPGSFAEFNTVCKSLSKKTPGGHQMLKRQNFFVSTHLNPNPAYCGISEVLVNPGSFAEFNTVCKIIKQKDPGWTRKYFRVVD